MSDQPAPGTPEPPTPDRESMCHLGSDTVYMCPIPATTRVTGGCVHEHIWEGPVCAYCAVRAVRDGGVCGVCRDPDEGQGDPHECRMIFREIA